MSVLRRLRTTHHDLRLMAHHNFNVTVPIADRLFGTFHDPRPRKWRGSHHTGRDGGRSRQDSSRVFVVSSRCGLQTWSSAG